MSRDLELNVGDRSFRFGNRLAGLDHAFEMQFDGLADIMLDLLNRFPWCDASRKIRNIGR
jgi:hypothetical protein